MEEEKFAAGIKRVIQSFLSAARSPASRRYKLQLGTDFASESFLQFSEEQLFHAGGIQRHAVGRMRNLHKQNPILEERGNCPPSIFQSGDLRPSRADLPERHHRLGQNGRHHPIQSFRNRERLRLTCGDFIAGTLHSIPVAPQPVKRVIPSLHNTPALR